MPDVTRSRRESAGVVAAPVALPSGRIVASPRARMRAEQLKVNLRLLRGTGPGGRIVERDVLAYAQRMQERRITPTAREVAFRRGVDVLAIEPAGPRITKADVLAVEPAAAPAPAVEAAEPLSAMRRIVAQRMTESQQQVPHFYLSMDVDMTAAVAWREEHNRTAARKVGYNDMLIAAVARAMRDVPAMNVSWADGGLRRRREVNVGLAVALEEGLIVPVVRRADRMDLDAIAAETARLVERARNKRLTPDEYEGGGFTVSNLGMFGVDRFAAIVNPGESGILAVGRIAKRPVVVDDALHVRSMMTVTLSADHRVVDGAIAGQFLARVREWLEAPAEWEKRNVDPEP